ncbi:MAG: dihydropteroate synthase [Cellvibrionaceae bacterium]
MGILNVTPDSFSDGGECYSEGRFAIDLALRKAEKMLVGGADIIDIGGESTRPGAEPVTEQQELDRIVPLVEAIASRLEVKISVDTSTPEVMLQAAGAGAHLINDVRALQRDGALQAAAKTNLPVCLMHMQGDPKTMQDQPSYDNVVDEVESFLLRRVAACETAGIRKNKVWLDPGFGFGKTLEHNLQLFKALPELVAKDLPLLIGVSRKSMIGGILNRELDGRLAGSLALAQLAAQKGASILRVHDVAETVDVLKILKAINE